jgi:hypothetical protein
MDAAQDQRGTEAAVARRRYVERQLVGRKRLQPPPHPLKLSVIHTGTGTASINQPAVRVVIGKQQRAEIGPSPFGIGPADNDKFLAVEALTLRHRPRLPGT